MKRVFTLLIVAVLVFAAALSYSSFSLAADRMKECFSSLFTDRAATPSVTETGWKLPASAKMPKEQTEMFYEATGRMDNAHFEPKAYLGSRPSEQGAYHAFLAVHDGQLGEAALPSYVVVYIEENGAYGPVVHSTSPLPLEDFQ